jgi:hypothetical protein
MVRTEGIVNFLRFLVYIFILPVFYLLLLLFDLNLIRAANTSTQRTNRLFGVIGGVFAAGLIILLDQTTDFLVVHAALPDPTKIEDIWIYLLFSFLGGFALLLFTHILLKSQRALPFLCFFTILLISTSVYFLLKSPQIRNIFAVSSLAFLVGGICYFMFVPNVVPMLIIGFFLDTQSSLDLQLGSQYIRDIQVKADYKVLSDLSIAHPRLLSKRYESKFIIHMYSDETHDQVKSDLDELFWGEEFEQTVTDIRLFLECVVEIELYSPDIEFSTPVVKKLDQPINKVVFTGKPKDNCHTQKKHTVLLSIRDEETGYELESMSFDVQIVDYAFDHVSRPLLSNIAAGFSGFGAVVLFVLTLLEQIDMTFGLASGVAASAVATAVYARYSYLFRQTVKIQSP